MVTKTAKMKVVPKSAAKKKKKQLKLYANPQRALVRMAAKNEKKLEMIREQAKVLKLVKKGHTFEEVAQEINKERPPDLGISPKQALEMTKEAIDRWCGELALDAAAAKELDLKRIDALMVILWEQIEPKDMTDAKGRPVLDAETLEPIQTKPDYMAVKLYNDLMDKRARMLGFNADEPSVKVVNEVNIIERRYVGANPDVL